MFAIAFDLDVGETEKRHPKGVTQAYTDTGSLLRKHNFEWRQGSVYVSSNEDLADLFDAMTALKALSWFSGSVRDIRAFRVEQWSDLTARMKDPASEKRMAQ